jgi:hypothetical protein
MGGRWATSNSARQGSGGALPWSGFMEDSDIIRQTQLQLNVSFKGPPFQRSLLKRLLGVFFFNYSALTINIFGH